MNKVLVVGSRGFIGSYLMKQITADEIDLKDGNDIRSGISKKYKVIIFLACQQGNTQADYKHNYEMFRVLERYRKRWPKTHLIYISSVAVYYPVSIYCQSKRLGEYFASRFKKHSILRLSNVYGHGDGHGAPDRFLRGETNISGDGTQIRDLIPVEYAVDQIINFIESPRYGIFNISSGKGTTVNEMFKMFGNGTQPKREKSIKGEVVDLSHGVKVSIVRPGKTSESTY